MKTTEKRYLLKTQKFKFWPLTLFTVDSPQELQHKT